MVRLVLVLVFFSLLSTDLIAQESNLDCICQVYAWVNAKSDFVNGEQKLLRKKYLFIAEPVDIKCPDERWKARSIEQYYSTSLKYYLYDNKHLISDLKGVDKYIVISTHLGTKNEADKEKLGYSLPSTKQHFDHLDKEKSKKWLSTSTDLSKVVYLDSFSPAPYRKELVDDMVGTVEGQKYFRMVDDNLRKYIKSGIEY